VIQKTDATSSFVRIDIISYFELFPSPIVTSDVLLIAKSDRDVSLFISDANKDDAKNDFHFKRRAQCNYTAGEESK